MFCAVVQSTCLDHAPDLSLLRRGLNDARAHLAYKIDHLIRRHAALDHHKTAIEFVNVHVLHPGPGLAGKSPPCAPSRAMAVSRAHTHTPAKRALSAAKQIAAPEAPAYRGMIVAGGKGPGGALLDAGLTRANFPLASFGAGVGFWEGGT